MVGLLIALVAYAQARGVKHLVGAELSGAPSPAAPPEVVQAEQQPADATPILERNVFDSVTGPLTSDAVKPAVDRSPAASEPPAPTSAPACTFGHVTLIVASEPDYSFASITTEGASGRFYRVGDAVGESTIGAIEWDRVWLSGRDGRCQMRLGDKMRNKPAAPKKRKRRRRRGKKRPEPVPDHIADKIAEIGPGQYAIQRSAFDEVFEMKNGLVRGTRVRPVKHGGEVVGLSLNGRGVAEGSLLHSIGVRAGDVIKSINGFDISNPQKALEAYGRLRTAGRLTLELERNGRRQTIEYQIQ